MSIKYLLIFLIALISLSYVSAENIYWNHNQSFTTTAQNNYRIGMVYTPAINQMLLGFNTTSSSTSTICGIARWDDNVLVYNGSYTKPFCDTGGVNLTAGVSYVLFEYKASSYSGSINSDGAKWTPLIVSSYGRFNCSTYSAGYASFVPAGCSVGGGSWYAVWALSIQTVPPPVYTIKGVCSYNGTALANVNISLINPNSNTLYLTTVTNSTGEYNFSSAGGYAALANGTIWNVLAYYRNATVFYSKSIWVNITTAD